MIASPAAVAEPRYRPPTAHQTARRATAPPYQQQHQQPTIRPGRLVVARHPLLRTHRGSPPDLVLKWGAMPRVATVDVVVHLHGHWRQGPRMCLDRDMEPRSGLDLADPANPASGGRASPTLLILPRGHFYGGRSGQGYSFPAFKRRASLDALIDDALRRFSEATGVQARRGRLILTAHSGGGSALMTILRHTDPDEVHTFDALYRDPAALVDWVTRRRADPAAALRVLFRPGEPTEANSRRVAKAIGSGSPRVRVEATTVAHGTIGRVYGWRLLANPAADLPGTRRPDQPSTQSQPRTQSQQHEVIGPPATASPPLCATIARMAREEFHRWRPGGRAALSETAAAAFPMLRDYYRIGVGTTVTEANMRDVRFQKANPWSAVFISYVMRRAGAGRAFRYSAAHYVYVAAAKRNRLRGDASNPFWAYRATELVPRIGDLVCRSRRRSGATYDNVDDGKRRAAHCDIVVEVHPGRIRVIGGNAKGDTVGERWLRTLPDGRLSITGNQAGYFAIVRCGAAQPAQPAQPTQPTQPVQPVQPAIGPTPTPATPGTQDDRIRRVMGLLVTRYRYPVNAAAGIVGNLIAESAVLPNRIEGSNERTPMRARDFTGRLRDFTPDEVRDRNYARKTGPRHPGIGIAQWTSPNRRRGLFQHTYQGRQLGSAILSDLDAQVDYLVTELRRDYRPLNATLMAPGVSVAQASDAVLLRFERPKSVLHKPTTDPSVRAVLTRRRRLSVRALHAYGQQ